MKRQLASAIVLGLLVGMPSITYGAMFHSKEFDGNYTTYSFADGTVLESKGGILHIEKGEHVTFNAEGKLIYAGDHIDPLLFVESGTLIFTGNEVEINGFEPNHGYILAGPTVYRPKATLHFKNAATTIKISGSSIRYDHGALKVANQAQAIFDHGVKLISVSNPDWTKVGTTEEYLPESLGLYVASEGKVHAKEAMHIEAEGGLRSRGMVIRGASEGLVEGPLTVKVKKITGNSIPDKVEGYGIVVARAGKLTVNNDVSVQVLTRKGGIGIYAGEGSIPASVNIKGNANIQVKNLEKDEMSVAVFAEDKAKIDFGGAVIINNEATDNDKLVALNVSNGATVNINQTGDKKVQIKGDVTAKTGKVNLKLVGQDSYLRGAVVGEAATDNITMELRDNASWQLRGLSLVNNLAVDKAKIDLTTDNSNTTTLWIDKLTGEQATIKLETNLAKNIGDSVVICDSDFAVHFLQVQDASLKTGQAAHGELLLATTKNSKAIFYGKDLFEGGLWVSTPEIISRRDGTGSTDWCLRSLTKKMTGDTASLFAANETAYAALVRTDTMRQRLGELHAAETEKGLWARITGGKQMLLRIKSCFW